MIARGRSSPGARKRNQRGYALLLVVFLATTMLILAALAAPDIRIEGQREKEKEMIWRGRQYTRGIKLYYRKMGRFPTSLDDLTKPKIGSLRFMRQAYKDPMNAQDGSWRLIYVGPAGQLIGSLKPQPQNVLFGQAQVVPGTGIPNSGFGSVLGQAIGQVGGLNPQAQPGNANPQNPPATTGTPVSADQGTGTDANAAIPSDDPPAIIGGNIIGVGSKVNKKSVIVYEKANNYRLFEFIWDPSKDSFGMGQPGLQTGTGFGQPIGQPIGQPVGAPGVPVPVNPQQPPQNPPPQPPQ